MNATSVTRKKSPNVYKSCHKMISLEERFGQINSCQRLLKTCPKSNKSPNLVTLTATMKVNDRSTKIYFSFKAKKTPASKQASTGSKKDFPIICNLSSSSSMSSSKGIIIDVWSRKVEMRIGLGRCRFPERMTSMGRNYFCQKKRLQRISLQRKRLNIARNPFGK